jgi:aquaporin TIP
MVKLAFGSCGDSFSASSIKAYVAEFIATLLFVFAGVGSAIAYGELLIYVSKNFHPNSACTT